MAKGDLHYMTRCEIMIRKNEEQAAIVASRLSNEKDPIKRETLQMELDGWLEWVETWRSWLEEAKAAKKAYSS